MDIREKDIHPSRFPLRSVVEGYGAYRGLELETEEALESCLPPLVAARFELVEGLVTTTNASMASW